MKKQYLIVLIFLHASFIQFAAAQPVFNYDQYTICEGDSYDLAFYQNNEVVLPVGWEITGWKDVENTTVQPVTSPTVYTIEYRETANPSVIYTQNLTISLRSKPSVSISPNGTQIICEGDPIHIEKISAENYDDLYWIYVQKSDKSYTDHIDAVAERGNAENKMTYKLIATNNECTFLGQDEMEYNVIKDDEYSILDYYFTDVSIFTQQYRRYCSPVYLKNYLTPVSIKVPDMSTYNGVGYLYIDDYFQQSENDIVKLLRYDIVWEQEDQYTNGAVIEGINLTKNYTIEVDLYFKSCGTIRTYRTPGTISLSSQCGSNFVFGSYWCDQTKGEASFYFSGDKKDTVLNVTYENLTTPGKYIPGENTLVNSSGRLYADQRYVTFDSEAPKKLQYRIIIDYKTIDGIIEQKIIETGFLDVCQKDVVISYTPTRHVNNSIEYFSNFSNQDPMNYAGKASVDTIHTTICSGSAAYLGINSNVEGVQEIIWDDESRPRLVNEYAEQYFDYTVEKTPDNKYKMDVTPIPRFGYSAAVFKVFPEYTTVYTGTLMGLKFAFKVNVVNNHIAALDTAICAGQSIDLKGLERTENISGTVSWNAVNTVVSPIVDTKYMVYGITRNKCPGQADYTITDEVLVRVDAPLWVTTSDLTSCAGAYIDLKDAVNTNARNFEWFDENNNKVENIVTIDGDMTYRAEIRNGCGNTTEFISVRETEECFKYNFAQNDTAKISGCLGSSSFYLSVEPLLNDELPYNEPIINIISQPTYPGATISYTRSTKKISYSFTPQEPIKDSIQYEVICDFKRDTAWAYFIAEESENPLSFKDISFSGTELKMEMEEVNNRLYYYMISEDVSYIAGNVTDTNSSVFSSASGFEDGKYYIGVIDMFGTHCSLDDSIIIQNGQIVLPSLDCTNGTILFKEDFGGNDPSDPAIRPTGIPQCTYIYQADPRGDGFYALRKEGHPNSGYWYAVSDHTYEGNITRGYMMQVDGSSIPGTFYKTTLDGLCAGTQLYFSLWGMSVVARPGYKDAELKLVIESALTPGLVLATQNITFMNQNGGVWEQYGMSFDIPNNETSVVFRIENNSGSNMGNDFVLDDIEIRLCTPPVTVAVQDPCVGDSVTFSSSFVNNGMFAGPLQYKWLKSTTGDLTDQSGWLPVGNNAPTLKISSAAKSDEGYYRLAIGSLGSIDSENCRAMSDPVFLFVDENCPTPPVYTAVAENDTIYAVCKNQVKIPVLANDVFSCPSPTVTLKTTPALTGNSAVIINDSIVFFIQGEYQNQKDSVQYEINCNGVTDKAWIYVFITNTKDTTFITDEICFGQSYNFHGNLLTITGNYTDTLITNLGCDSIIILDLKVIDPVYFNDIRQICRGNSYSFNGQQLSQTGIYRDTLASAQGCDSIIILDLKVIDPVYFNDTRQICRGNSYSFNGQQLSQTGIYRDTLVSALGCDSIIVLDLTVTDTIYFHDNRQICEGSSFNFNGKLLSQAGIYRDTLTSAQGCDSIVTIHLTELPLSPVQIQTTEIKQGEYVIFNNRKYDIEGVYSDTLKNQSGCDSIVVLHLSVVPASVCPDIHIPLYFSPNGDNVQDKWIIKNIECYTEHEIEIYDRFGKLLCRCNGDFTGWDGMYLNKPMPSTDYWYILKLYSGAKSRVGHFTLIR